MCVCACMCVSCIMSVPVVLCIRHDDEPSVISRAIVHHPPGRSIDRPIGCLAKVCDTSSSSFYEQHVTCVTSDSLFGLRRPREFTLHRNL